MSAQTSAIITTLLLLSLLPLSARAQEKLEVVKTTVVITAKPLEPTIDTRNAEVFQQTLFSRDDQIFHQLNAGINAGQHEGGGKSIRVLQEANIINGPFSAEYGDFSGLGVVHIRLRDSMPDKLTARFQGGAFNTQRGFLAVSPDWKNIDSFLANEGSHSDGPFVKPLGYRRDNVTANFLRRLSERRTVAIKFNGGLNRYDSSGQIPIEAVNAGLVDRFGFLDPGKGGKIRSGTVAGYFRQEQSNGAVWKADAFVGRSLFDLFSNFTYFLNDPVSGDAIQQHDSRLQEGANLQYTRTHKIGPALSLLTAGGNFHDNQINVEAEGVEAKSGAEDKLAGQEAGGLLQVARAVGYAGIGRRDRARRDAVNAGVKPD